MSTNNNQNNHQSDHKLDHKAEATEAVQNTIQPAGAHDNVELIETNKELEEANSLIHRLKVTLADSENEKKRLTKQATDQASFAIQSFVKDLSDVVDVFFMAVSSIGEETIKKDEKFKAFFDGIVMTKDNFVKALTKHGVERVHPLDLEFDPNLHQAVATVPSEKPKGHVVNVIKAGYVLNSRLIVPAMVVVSNGEAPQVS